MGLYAIFDEACSCGEAVGFDPDGVEAYVVVVKQTFTWDAQGQVHAVAPRPVVEADVSDGDPARGSVLYEAEIAPSKPRVDVLLAGEIALGAVFDRAVIQLEVGARIRKAARVFGDRVWVPGAWSGLHATEPRPFERMPLTWSRAFGGVDPREPRHLDMQNPAGTGFARSEESATGMRLPNYEDPDALVGSWKSRPRPLGFGPVGRSWPSRVRWAGTYDQAWLDEQFPLLPRDFDDRFFNCAPEDQQLDTYVPGERVRLRGMTPDGDTSFALPPFAVPVAILDRGGRRTDGLVAPDTVIIEPAARCFSLVGRFRHVPRPNLLAIEDVLVGTPWKGWLRARTVKKRYVGRDPRAAR
jgi:hypothetical protein